MSADGRVVLEASARFDRLETAFARQGRIIERYEKQLASVTRRLDALEKTGVRGNRNLFVSAAKVAGTYLSIHQAVNLATQAITDNIEKQRIASDLNRSFQDSRNEFLTQIGSLTPKQRTFLERNVLAIGRRAGLDENMIFPTFQAAFSSTDEKDANERIRRSLAAFKESTELFGRGLQNFRTVQGGILQLQRITQDSMANTAGKVVRFLEQSPAISPEAIPKMVQAVSAQIAQSGALTPKDRQRVADDAMAVLSTLAAVGFDPELAISRTGTVNIMPVLREAVQQGRAGQSTIDLIESFIEQGLNPDEYNFKGKSFTKDMQRELARELRKVAGTAANVLAQQVEVFRSPVGPASDVVKGLQAGATDAARARARVAHTTQARGDELLRLTEGAEGSVRDILFGISQQTGSFAGLNYFQRGGLRFDLWMRQFATSPMQAEEAGINVLQRAFEQRTGRGMITEPLQSQMFPRELDLMAKNLREVLAAEPPDKIAATIQKGIADLITIIAAREAEIANLGAAAEDRRTQAQKDYAEALADMSELAEKILNAGIATGRINAEVENNDRP